MKKLLKYFGYMPVKEHNKGISNMIQTYSERNRQLMKNYRGLSYSGRNESKKEIEVLQTVIKDLFTLK